MPCLIPEILFDIAKKLVEDRNSDAVIQFGLSGKECFKALANVFASVTTLELYDNHFAVGWDKQCSMFDVKKVPKFLLHCIGGSVKKLHIEREFNPLCQPIIDQIVAQKKLISFSAGNDSYYCSEKFINEFLPLFSSTLKDVKIPSRAMSETFCDKLCPENLTLSNIFNLNIVFLLRLLSTSESSSLFKSSIKHLTFVDKTGSFSSSAFSCQNIIQTFSSLETLNFNMKYRRFIKNDIQAIIKIIQISINLPSKIVYTVLSDGNDVKHEICSNLRICQDICKEFEYNASNESQHSFHQTFQTASSQMVLLEVLIPKRQKLTSEFILWMS
uniref:DUF4371 domain-containing protein n=1 Tax=Panagrolaimus sp. ES5 TaxID=591445 RepID=A0AC34FY78_9BILA